MGMDSHQAHTHMVFLSVLTPLSPSCFTLPCPACLSVRLPLATFVLCEIRKAVSVVNIQEELLPKSLQWVSFRVTYVHTRPCERRAAVAPNTRQQHCPGRHSCIFIFCQLTWLFDKSGGAREESEWKRVPVARHIRVDCRRNRNVNWMRELGVQSWAEEEDDAKVWAYVEESNPVTVAFPLDYWRVAGCSTMAKKGWMER